MTADKSDRYIIGIGLCMATVASVMLGACFIAPLISKAMRNR